MPIPSSEVIARTVAVLEEICILLDDEIDERTHHPKVFPEDALKCKDAQDAVQIAIAKLLTAGAALVAPEQRPEDETAQGVPLSDDNASEAPTTARHVGVVR